MGDLHDLKAKIKKYYRFSPKEILGFLVSVLVIAFVINTDTGSFIINGTEKVLINIEDLAANRMMVEKQQGPSEYVGKLFSEKGSFKIPHTLEKMKDGIFYLTFTRVRRIPVIVIIKSLGLLKDEEIMNLVSRDKKFDEVIINLFEFVDIKTEEDALDYVAKRIGITQSKEIRIERMKEILDRYLLPHLGLNKEDRVTKAYNLCKLIKKIVHSSKYSTQPLLLMAWFKRLTC